MNQLTLLITINASTLVTLLIMSARLLRFVNRMEFKVEEMWLDYKQRSAHTHKRASDE